MKKCNTCKWWTKPEDGDGIMKITDPIDPDTYDPMEMPWDVRFCACPRIRFYERPIEPDEAAVVDGSEYFAKLCTGPDFGCVLHEECDTSNAEHHARHVAKRSDVA